MKKIKSLKKNRAFIKDMLYEYYYFKIYQPKYHNINFNIADLKKFGVRNRIEFLDRYFKTRKDNPNFKCDVLLTKSELSTLLFSAFMDDELMNKAKGIMINRNTIIKAIKIQIDCHKNLIKNSKEALEIAEKTLEKAEEL